MGCGWLIGIVLVGDWLTSFVVAVDWLAEAMLFEG